MKYAHFAQRSVRWLKTPCYPEREMRTLVAALQANYFYSNCFPKLCYGNISSALRSVYKLRLTTAVIKLHAFAKLILKTFSNTLHAVGACFRECHPREQFYFLPSLHCTSLPSLVIYCSRRRWQVVLDIWAGLIAKQEHSTSKFQTRIESAWNVPEDLLYCI